MRRLIVPWFLALSLVLLPRTAFADHPMFIVTMERRAVWARMKADYEASRARPATIGGIYYKMIKEHAECACKYGDNGIWGSLMYQITREPKYGTLAWNKINESFLAQPDDRLQSDFSRANFASYVLWYDWLYPVLSSGQRSQYLAKLNVMARNVVTNKWMPNFPIRGEDSDQMVGDYFGLAMLYLATGTENPTIVEIWRRPYIGGFASTGTSGTFRNMIRAYVAIAKGGEWIESSDYNLGTVKLLTLGYEAVRTARGQDDFPEIASLIPELAARHIHIITPDLLQSYQWGDDEHPRDFRGRLFNRQETAMVLAGLLQPQPIGRQLQDLVYAVIEKYGPTGYQSGEPWGRAFLVWNPYAPRERMASLHPSSWAAGIGMLLHRTGWSRDDRLFGAHFPPFQPIDHFPSYFGEFQLYRKGAWAITHPIGYGGPPFDGRGTNSMLIGALPYTLWTFREFKEAVAQETTATYAYVAGTTGGQIAEQGSWNPPPTFLHEWTRSIVYLPGSADLMVIHDRVNAVDPRSLATSGYHHELLPQIQGMPALKQWFVHAVAQPRISGESAEWNGHGVNRVRLDILLPRGATAIAEDERLLWPKDSAGVGYVADEEKKWHVRVTPRTDQQWDTFLNVLQAHDGSFGRVSLVRSGSGEAEGALVEGDREDALLLFNGQPGSPLPKITGTWSPQVREILRNAHFRRSGFEIRFNAGVHSVRAYVFDLPKTSSWTAQVDDGPPAALSVSGAGVGQVTIPAGGSRKLRVWSGGSTASPTNASMNSGAR